MKKFKLYLFALFATLAFVSCEEDVEAPGTNYVTFGDNSYMTGVDPGGSATFEIPVYTANTSGSDRTFALVVDGSGAAAGSYTVPNSVVIPGGTNEGMISVALSDTNLGIGVNTVVISLVAEEGLSVGGSTSLNYIQNCNEVSGTLDIVFDGYGSETSWEITDALGGVVASGSGYADGQATASESVTLCIGRDYTFTIYDSYGDGLSWPSNGTYTLTVGGDVKASGGGDFGTDESTAFDTN